MKIMFWNVRGLGKGFRRSLVKDHVIQEDLDVVALQETIKQNFDDIELKELSGNRDFTWIWSSARGHSWGLITGVKSESLEIEESVSEDYFWGY
jgi:exonuclease III